MIESALILGTVLWTVLVYVLIQKIMSALKDLQDAVLQLQQVSALVQQALADSATNVAAQDVAASTNAVLNVVDGLKQSLAALPVKPA